MYMRIKGWLCLVILVGCSPVIPATQATVETPPTLQNTATNVAPPTQTPTELPTATPTSIFYDPQCGIDYAEALFQNGLADYQTVPVLTYRTYETQIGNNEELSKEVLDEIAFVVAQIAHANPEDISRVIIPQYTRTSTVIDKLQEWFQGDMPFDLEGYDSNIDMQDEGTLLVSVHAGKERWDMAVWRSSSITHRPDGSAKISGDLMVAKDEGLYVVPGQKIGGTADIAIVDSCESAVIVTPDNVNVAAVLKPDADIVNAPTTAWIVNPNEFEIAENESMYPENPGPFEITVDPGITFRIGENPGPTPDTDWLYFGDPEGKMMKRTWYTILTAEDMGTNEADIEEYVENLTDEKIDAYIQSLPKVNGHPVVEELWVPQRAPGGDYDEITAVRLTNVRADEAIHNTYLHWDEEVPRNVIFGVTEDTEETGSAIIGVNNNDGTTTLELNRKLPAFPTITREDHFQYSAVCSLEHGKIRVLRMFANYSLAFFAVEQVVLKEMMDNNYAFVHNLGRMNRRYVGYRDALENNYPLAFLQLECMPPDS